MLEIEKKYSVDGIENLRFKSDVYIKVYQQQFITQAHLFKGHTITTRVRDQSSITFIEDGVLLLKPRSSDHTLTYTTKINRDNISGILYREEVNEEISLDMYNKLSQDLQRITKTRFHYEIVYEGYNLVVDMDSYFEGKQILEVEFPENSKDLYKDFNISDIIEGGNCCIDVTGNPEYFSYNQ